MGIKNKIKNYFEKHIHKYKKEEADNKYYDLTPETNISNGNEYFKVLSWALKQDRINNIAISGPYGAGKSSVIDSFLIKNPKIKKRSLKISLATFGKKEEGRNGSDESLDDIIENGILRQLFYHVSFNRIPQSRYRKIHKINQKGIFGVVTAISLLTIIYYYIFENDTYIKKRDLVLKVTDSIPLNIDFGKFKISYNISIPNGYIYLIVLLLIVVINLVAVGVICWCIGKISNVEINVLDKAKLKGNSMDESAFDKNLDEIVYFFEATQYSILFIEDLDRFENTEIFTKLRELNILLNNYEPIKKKHNRIVFIYAIRDDMFSDTERTKFFDFTIPIVPYINSTNSGELLRRRLNELNAKEEKYVISEMFITKISPFICDMRILSSIVNEFIIYKATIVVGQNMKLDDEKMLALMIFKNLHPDIFSQMESENGLVRKAFDGKKQFISDKIEELEKDINKESIQLMQDEYLEREQIEEINFSINEKKERIYQLRVSKLSSLISTYDAKKVLPEEVFECKLLVFLLRNGYLDETYANYINYFHPDSINVEENSFIVNLRTFGGVLDYTIPMPHVDHVCDRLISYEYGQIEILNFELVDYVISNKREKEKLLQLVGLFSKRTSETIDFIIAYIQRGNYVGTFLQAIVSRNSSIWDDVIQQEKISEMAKQNCFVEIITNVETSDIQRLNGQSKVEEYIQSNKNILSILSNVPLKKIEDVFDKLEIALKDADVNKISMEMFNSIIENHFYAINDVMLKRIVEVVDKNALETFDKANYGTLKSLNTPSIIEYISENIVTYIKDVFLAKDTNIDETEESIVELIRSIEFETELSCLIIEHERIWFEDIEIWLDYVSEEENTIGKRLNTIIPFCYAKNKVLPNWDNVERYYSIWGYTSELQEYIGNNIAKLSSLSIETLSKNAVKDFINDNKWNLETYSALVDRFSEISVEIEIENLDEDHLDILIKKGYIDFSQEYFDAISYVSERLLIGYIFSKPLQFMNDIGNLEINCEILKKILVNDSPFTNSDKVKILQYIRIADVTQDVAFFIRDSKEKIPKPYILAAFDKLDNNDKYEFILKHINDLNNDDLSVLFSKLDEEHKQLADQSSARKVYLYKDGYNERLVEALKDKKYVTSSGDENEFYLYCRIKVKK